MSHIKIKQLALPLIVAVLLLVTTSSSSHTTEATRQAATIPGTPIQYTSFSGVTYQLHAFDGHYVRYALPDSWLAADGLSDEELREMIDLTDLVYLHLTEIVGSEPPGSGLLTMAVVPTGGATPGESLDGLGLVGAKGVEISPGQLANLRQDLKLGQIPDIFIHELAHNYDLFNHYLSYYPDWRHAWTTFLIPYVQYYSQTGSKEFEPSQLLDAKISAYTTTWDQLGAGAGWASCVRDQTCPAVVANEAWAGFLLRYARLHGEASVKGAFSYLQQYIMSHPTPPTTPEAMNDLLVMALAAGAHLNISCEIDYWKWSLTDQTRALLNSQFPSSSACLDQDGDTYTPLEGDTDDQNKNIHPGATETINGTDDDSDGIIDDLLLRETTDFPAPASAASPVVEVPARIQGYAEAGGQDAIILNIHRPGLLRLNLRNRGGFFGWISLDNRATTSTAQSYYPLASPIAVFAVDCPGQWVVTITPDAGLTAGSAGGAGNYDLTIEEETPAADQLALHVTESSQGNTLHLSATLNPAQASTATMIRFWASGVGVIKTVPFAQQTEFDWTPPAGLSVVGLRAELLAGDNPTSRISSAVWVNTATGAAAGLATDLLITPVTLAPSTLNYDQTASCGFEVINQSPVAANQVTATITLDPTLQVANLVTTRGVTQGVGSNVATITIDRLAAGQIAVFSLSVSALKANGTTTSTISVLSSTPDHDTSNNGLTVTINVTGQVPPSPYLVEPLPLRTESTDAAKVVARGSLARAIFPMGGVNVAAAYANPDISGNWPTAVGGVSVTVGGVPASVISLTPAPDVLSTTFSYRVDFAVPDSIIAGNNVPVVINYLPGNLRWTSAINVVESAPAFYADGGTTVGDALASDADTFLQITSGHPATADNQQRTVLYATGIRHVAVSLSVLAATSDGQNVPVSIDYAGPQSRVPGLDQLIIRLPRQLAGKGKISLHFASASFQSQVALPVN